MKKIFLAFIVLLSTTLFAKTIAIVQKVDGIVKVKHKKSIRKMKVKKGYKVQQGDIISTYRKSHLVLQLLDRSKIALDERSTIAFSDANHIAQKEGKVYYKITHRQKKNHLKIKTQFAIIGIKGTTFIVDTQKNEGYVALKEGKIGIASIKEEFNLYKKKVMDDFMRFKQQQEAQFQEYKKQYSDYTLTVTKAFDLEAGHKVRFKPDAVVEEKIDSKRDFSFFERMIRK